MTYEAGTIEALIELIFGSNITVEFSEDMSKLTITELIPLVEPVSVQRIMGALDSEAEFAHYEQDQESVDLCRTSYDAIDLVKEVEYVAI